MCVFYLFFFSWSLLRTAWLLRAVPLLCCYSDFPQAHSTDLQAPALSLPGLSVLLPQLIKMSETATIFQQFSKNLM